MGVPTCVGSAYLQISVRLCQRICHQPKNPFLPLAGAAFGSRPASSRAAPAASSEMSSSVRAAVFLMRSRIAAFSRSMAAWGDTGEI